MKAMVIEQFGEPEVFREATLPHPALMPGHVLIEVAASSVNAVDLLIRRMGPPFLASPFPAILHSDVAGVVVDVAPDVVHFKPGDEVYGCAGGLSQLGGALADYMAADAALIAHKPERLTMEEAAAMPLVTITAWEALKERCSPGPGQRVLIHGGTGGVGHMAVQLAKLAGAEVFTTVSSPEKAAIARRLGATTTIDYRQATVEEYVREHTEGKGFDLVFDTIGNDNLERSFAAAKLNGDVVTTVALGQYDLTQVHLRGLSLHVVFMLIPLLHNIHRHHHGRVLELVAKLVDEGKLQPLLDPHRFRFTEVADAHRLMESGQHIGKIVLSNN